ARSRKGSQRNVPSAPRELSQNSLRPQQRAKEMKKDNSGGRIEPNGEASRACGKKRKGRALHARPFRHIRTVHSLLPLLRPASHQFWGHDEMVKTRASTRCRLTLHAHAPTLRR